VANSDLTDRELVAAFEACTLDDFSHPDHVRVAWIYLTELPFPEASRRMTESVRRFAASKGATEKYHETITHAWMRLVWAAMEKEVVAQDALSNLAAFQERFQEIEEPQVRSAGPALQSQCTDSLAADSESFAAAHPELLDSHLLDKFYSRELLATPTARAEFVSPDLSPLP
jgi:hypothetical protein